ncbi:MAG: aldehyde ferredoxin oxidoreductase family protein, partial [Smithellaceae bacterium]|nr:aldehyde ferredoxin oxidoreductase family protein [Smithellaceae bacterium]
MNGYNGKILRINLSDRSHTVDKPAEDYYRHYLGGRGIIVHTLLTEVPAGIDPLGPENKLIFAPGPLTGHPLPGSGRNSVGAKSPLTGGFGEAEAGGFWGAELKRAGYDAIIVEGASSVPVYVWIDNGAVEIREALHLWGLEVAAADSAIKGELGSDKIRTALIGPGGEKLVRYACIANDITHFAGRTGLGAVMGSKKLKAIAVRGNTPPTLADREKLLALARWLGRNFKEKDSGHYLVGTGSTMRNYEISGKLPVRNFRGGDFPEVEQIIPQQMFAKGYIKKRETCFACPIRCKRVVSLEAAWKVDPRYGAPEYETLGALGSNCGVSSLEALMKANEICARYGIDTISTGVSVSFAMECYERGILTRDDTDGLELTFGNARALVELVERIARRQGLGDILAEGTKRAAERIGRGAADYAIHVKGLELPMHEPRYKQGMGLHYSVNASGADHCTGVQDDQVRKKQAKWETLPGTELSPRKALMVYEVGLWRHLANYVGMCVFLPWSNQQICDAVTAVTGWPMSFEELMKVAERGITLTRIFNLREGFSRGDDTLP